ncbi:hypothetical protein M9H77_28559 [Catharanthus roseus]|uniref:Uncharacterized protein n=1 Tax=Catharanthus roseus TaxID=4058 RepID=A0ACC0AGP8_CATRO|nr:hypothetical protein M9H77_28559 [Catharanthus roseus]
MELEENQDRVPHEASRYRRIRLPYDCAQLVSAIGQRFGHANPGQTIEWLLNEAKTLVEAVLARDSTSPPPPFNFQAYYQAVPTIIPFPPTINPTVNQNFVHP